MTRRAPIGLLVLALLVAGAFEATAKPATTAAPLLPGSNAKDPVNIEADRLEYFNKEQKAVYSGNVIAVQGDSTLKCSKLTILIDRQPPKAGDAKGAGADAVDAGPGASGSSIRRMEAEGPVTLVSRDDVGTGDRGEYDKVANKLYLIGHVVLTQGANVTKGDKLTYDTTSGVAVVDSGGSSGRVSGFFLPGSQNGGEGKPNRTKGGRKPPKPIE